MEWRLLKLAAGTFLRIRQVVFANKNLSYAFRDVPEVNVEVFV
jgi:hypothetical protein